MRDIRFGRDYAPSIQPSRTVYLENNTCLLLHILWLSTWRRGSIEAGSKHLLIRGYEGMMDSGGTDYGHLYKIYSIS